MRATTSAVCLLLLIVACGIHARPEESRLRREAPSQDVSLAGQTPKLARPLLDVNSLTPSTGAGFPRPVSSINFPPGLTDVKSGQPNMQARPPFIIPTMGLNQNGPSQPGIGPMGQNQMGPNQVRQNQVGPEQQMGPFAMRPGQMGPNPMGPFQMGSGQMSPYPMGPPQLGPNQMEFGPMGSFPTGLNPPGSGPMGLNLPGSRPMGLNLPGSGPMGPNQTEQQQSGQPAGPMPFPEAKQQTNQFSPLNSRMPPTPPSDPFTRQINTNREESQPSAEGLAAFMASVRAAVERARQNRILMEQLQAESGDISQPRTPSQIQEMQSNAQMQMMQNQVPPQMASYLQMMNMQQQMQGVPNQILQNPGMFPQGVPPEMPDMSQQMQSASTPIMQNQGMFSQGQGVPPQMPGMSQQMQSAPTPIMQNQGMFLQGQGVPPQMPGMSQLMQNIPTPVMQNQGMFPQGVPAQLPVMPQQMLGMPTQMPLYPGRTPQSNMPPFPMPGVFGPQQMSGPTMDNPAIPQSQKQNDDGDNSQPSNPLQMSKSDQSQLSPTVQRPMSPGYNGIPQPNMPASMQDMPPQVRMQLAQQIMQSQIMQQRMLQSQAMSPSMAASIQMMKMQQMQGIDSALKQMQNRNSLNPASQQDDDDDNGNQPGSAPFQVPQADPSQPPVLPSAAPSGFRRIPQPGELSMPPYLQQQIMQNQMMSPQAAAYIQMMKMQQQMANSPTPIMQNQGFFPQGLSPQIIPSQTPFFPPDAQRMMPQPVMPRYPSPATGLESQQEQDKLSKPSDSNPAGPEVQDQDDDDDQPSTPFLIPKPSPSPTSSQMPSAVPGPIKMPAQSVEDLIKLESKLDYVRSELIKSFYSDLFSFRQIAGSLQQRMTAKLALIHLVESRMGMPLRGNLIRGMMPQDAPPNF